MKVWYLVFFFLLVCIYEANAKYFANGAIVGGIVAAKSSKSRGPEKIKGGPLEKSAVNGIGTYGNLAAKYSSWKSGQHWDFNNWNDWREVDGFLCRTTSDCSWIDPRLYCQDYELMFTPNVSLKLDFSAFKMTFVLIHRLSGLVAILPLSRVNAHALMRCFGIMMT